MLQAGERLTAIESLYVTELERLAAMVRESVEHIPLSMETLVNLAAQVVVLDQCRDEVQRLQHVIYTYGSSGDARISHVFCLRHGDEIPPAGVCPTCNRATP